MKKFIKSTIVLVLILGSLGTYYVQSAMLTNDLPRYEIEHVSGDEQLVEDLMIYGRYMNEEVNDNYLLMNKGIEYRSDLNLVERFEGHNKTIDRLRDEYPGFMRGTIYIYNNLYEDEDVVMLLEEHYEYENGESVHQLEVSMLNKETEDESEYSVTVEDMNQVKELQYVNGNIHIYIQKHDSSSQSYKVDELVIDTENGELESEKTVIEGKQITLNNQHANLSKLVESVLYQPMNYIVFRDQIETIEEGEDGYRVQNRKEDLLAYNIETGEVETLDLSPEEYGYAAMFDGQYLYFEDYSDEGEGIVKPYDIASGDFLDSITVQVDEQNPNNLKTVKEGKLFIINQPKLKVIDVKSGEVIYEGEIVSEDDQDLEHMNVDFMEFR